MAPTRRELNPEILRESLPDNYREVLNQAEINVKRAVDILIDDYKKTLDSQARQLEEGTFPQDLQARISELEENLRTGLNQARASANDIKDKAEELKDKLQDKTALKTLANQLSVEARKLQGIIDETRAKVREVGKLSGQTLGAALRTLI